MRGLSTARAALRAWFVAREAIASKAIQKAGTLLLLGLLLVASACLRQRMTGEQVLTQAQRSLRQGRGYHAVLEIEVDTDLIKDTLVVELWEEPPTSLRLAVLESGNPQLRGLEFATDGTQSRSYLPHANAVTVGPAESVRLPSVLETPVQARSDWILDTEADVARVVGVERSAGLVLYHVQADVGEHEAVQFWIDARDWLVRRVTYADTFLGSATIVVSDVQLMDDVPDTQLELDVPDGVPVTEVARDGSR
jgi:outer membrane lipoprotein-sorting protein